MPGEPFGWLCPLVHLLTFSFRWLETVFLGQEQGHVPQESISAASLLAHWEQGVKGLLICGWKVSGLLISHCLEVRLKSREQQFALRADSVLLHSPYAQVGECLWARRCAGGSALRGHGCPGRGLVPQPRAELTRLAPILLPRCPRTPPKGLTPVTCLG